MPRPRSRSGQSLLEAMIALSVLVMGFLGIGALLVRSFSLSRLTADQTTATYLAAEGVEIAKNLIDHDVYEYLAGTPGYGWGACFGVGGDFQLDYMTTCSPGNHPPAYNGSNHLLFDPATGFYGYGGSVTTPYTRDVRVSVPNANEIVVDSIVQWTVNGAAQSVTLEDAFYNWHP